MFLISRKLVSNFRSYPTYEEWKQYFRNNLRITSLYSSYPTYEEWKLSTVSPVFLTSIGSYPTYEEWKHNFIEKWLCFIRKLVLILPMRNGNFQLFTNFIVNEIPSSYPTYEEWKLIF